MRVQIVGGVLLGVLTLAGPVQTAELDTAKCVFPAQAPVLPDGSAASQEEMVTASGAVKAFVAENERGLACLDEIKAGFAAEPMAPEQDALFTSTYNAAVDAARLVGDNWNAAVRAYKAKDPG